MIRYRKYPDVNEYQTHQGSKIEKNPALLTEGSSAEWIHDFVHELMPFIGMVPVGRVICLGARRGAEVGAWQVFGFESIGIDLNPGPQTEDTFGDKNLIGKVVCGDFHDIPDELGMFDVVYCNCLDHCQDINQVLESVKGCLNRPGYFVMRFLRECKERDGSWESCFWDSSRDILEVILRQGFEIVYHEETSYRMHADREDSLVVRLV